MRAGEHHRVGAPSSGLDEAGRDLARDQLIGDRRTVKLLFRKSGEPPSPARIAFTSGRVPSPALAAALAHFGMAG